MSVCVSRIICDAPHAISFAEKLSIDLNIPLGKKQAGDAAILRYDEHGLSLEIFSPEKISYRIDYTAGRLWHRARTAGRTREPLLRAVRGKRGGVRSVADLCAGFGHDALMMAVTGLQVYLIEQHPVVFALLADAHQRLALAHSNVASRMCLVQAAAEDWLKDHHRMCDAYYLDPMFPASKQSAQVKKPMQLLQALVGCDLVDWAASGVWGQGGRVIVKRPRLAKRLVDCAPDYVVPAGVNRFDVYLDGSVPCFHENGTIV